MNTADYLLQDGDDTQPAIIAKDALFSYHELRQASQRLAGELVAAGIGAQDRVGLLGENSLFWAAAYLAILKIGAVAAPLSTVTTSEDLLWKKSFFNFRALCIDLRTWRKFASAISDDVVLVLEDVLRTPGPTYWEAAAPDFDVSRDAALMLTSGTTARPRAVRITHRNIQANTDSIIQYLDLKSDERILVILPFYYCFGASLLHTHLRVGGSLVICNTFAYPETALDMMEATGCTGMAGVPSTYQSLLRNTSFPRRSLPGLRKIQQAGGKLQPVLIEELSAAAPQARVYVMYGQTEATARLSYLPPELLHSKLGSIGKGIPNVELRVVNETGKDVLPSEVGEIQARGANISPGYWDEPQATAEKFIGDSLRTGDLATVDQDGYIYIVDRKGDFIKSFGHRVSSQEVEAHIAEIPEVVSVAAVGVPDAVAGEAITVFVTLRQGSSLTPDDILAICHRRMARHTIPKEVIILDSLPVNANGKIVKSALREMKQVKAGK